MVFKDIVSHFKVKERSGDSVKCLCPHHADKEASLSITLDSKTGNTLLNCHAGCNTEDILQDVGLKMSDLFQENRNGGWISYIENYITKTKGNSFRYVDRYDYSDIHGKYLFSKVRLQDSNGKKEIRYGIIDDEKGRIELSIKKVYGKSVKNLGGLYGDLGKIRQAITNGASVFYCEGEKDVNSMTEKGYTAFTLGGADDWRSDFAGYLKNAKLIILQDNDEAGEKLSKQIYHDVYEIAQSVRVIIPVPDTPKADISDFFKDHDKEDFEKLLSEAVDPSWMNEPEDQDNQGNSELWKNSLEMDDKGKKLLNNLHNLRLILENDEKLKGIVFNQLADGIEIKSEVPWNHPGKLWRDADDAQLVYYIDQNYGAFSKEKVNIALTKVADDRSYHPVKEMFESLPAWDGTERVDKLFIDYLGAEDNAYTRAVTRKILCAAYMRIYHPGIKFDYMVVLNGRQGIGKSTLLMALGMDWFSDSLSISDMNDKTAAEKLQGFWLHEIGELAGWNRSDINKIKAFISRQSDDYRASYGKRVSPHPRQCIFIGTTNNENGFLIDTTGNRRFWPIQVLGNSKFKPWEIKREEVCQIWAEVEVIARAGEKLYLPPEIDEIATNEQKKVVVHDPREGLVRDYLDKLLPDNWESMSIIARQNFVHDRSHERGTIQRMTVSNAEIWSESFERPFNQMKRTDA